MTAEGRPIRVVLMDHHPVLRTGLAQILRRMPDLDVVGEVGDPTTLLDVVNRTDPDVVLLDVELPGSASMELARQLCSECPGVVLIGLSLFEDANLAAAIQTAGASAYIHKNRSAADLADLIRTACARLPSRTDGGATRP
jgi:DNA-binding NarL/FixJ family response regulator